MRCAPVLLAGLAAALIVAGCHGAGTASKQAQTEGAALGQNLVGEECHSVPLTDAATDPGAPPPFNILCGTSKGLAGVVDAAVLPLSVPEGGSARHDAVERAAGLTPAALGIAARMSCRPGHWLPAQEGNEVLVAPCFLNEGGWPQIVVTVAVGKTLYQAEGLRLAQRIGGAERKIVVAPA